MLQEIPKLEQSGRADGRDARKKREPRSSAAVSRVRPKNIAAVMVLPDRDDPGIRASA